MTYRRVAVISDVHGNAPALAAVLAEIATLDVDLIVSCGDLLAGPMPRETAALVAGLGDGIRHVRGNTDREVADVYDGASPEHAGAAHAAAAMGPEERALLDRFEPTVLITVDGLGEVCCCHATHRDDETILTYLTSDERLASELTGAPAPTVVGGHTHMQVDRRVGGIRYVNAGSVGMPYEGVPGAYWVLLGPDVEHRRTPYDIAAAAAAIEASGMPEAAEFAADYVAISRSREETAALFESRAAE